MQVMNLRVQQLEPSSAGDRARLVRFPFRLYKGDPYWVPPLIGDRKKFLDPASNPSFEYLRVAYFVAEAVVLPENQSSGRMGGGMEQDVGTIAAIVNPLHNEIWHDRVGFFGLFETVNSQEVAEALFSAAADWLRQQGCTAMRGPVTLTINDEVGVLIDGFDDSPRILMSYNHPYYPELIEASDFEGVMDLYAYHFDLVELYGGIEDGLPPKVLRVMNKLKERSNLTLRKVDMAHFDEELERVKGVYREAWAANWGEVPITDAEIKYIGAQLKPIIDPDFVHLIEVGDKTVGVALTVPDANFVLKRMGGHLFPFGWIQALRYQNKIPWLRVLILGVLPEYRLRGADVMLFYQIVTEAMRKGIKDIEASWVLATNDEANRSTANLGGKVYKRYRVYEREI